MAPGVGSKRRSRAASGGSFVEGLRSRCGEAPLYLDVRRRRTRDLDHCLLTAITGGCGDVVVSIISTGGWEGKAEGCARCELAVPFRG